MFVINPDPYSLPCYRIGPFQTRDLSINHNLQDSEVLNEYLNDRFGGKEVLFTVNGREAINLALDHFNLKKNDVVTILTTSGNLYISGCVTKEIEKFCKWSRRIVPETKIIFVNHEFGYIYPDMEYLISLGFPIVEDCCTTFFSQNQEMKVGTYGDFAIYSFPKFFPIQIGGMLVNNNNLPLVKDSIINSETKSYIKRVLGNYLGSINELLDKRNSIFNYGIDLYKSIGLTERFNSEKFTVPSVMLLNNNSIIKDLPLMKTILWAHGIQSSVFYGEDAFFIPSHQNLDKNDLFYFFEVLKSTIK
jgi:hypothetical protein